MKSKQEIINNLRSLVDQINEQIDCLQALFDEDCDNCTETSNINDNDDDRWRFIIKGEGELPPENTPVLIRRIGTYPEFSVGIPGNVGDYQWQPLKADLSICLDNDYVYCDEAWARKDPRAEYRYKLLNGKYNKQWNKVGEKLAGEMYKEQRLFRIPKYPYKKIWNYDY